jgi:hypothetical protein
MPPTVESSSQVMRVPESNTMGAGICAGVISAEEGSSLADFGRLVDES